MIDLLQGLPDIPDIIQRMAVEDKPVTPNVRISDIGRCALELHAAHHGLLDMPQDPETALTRLGAGRVLGEYFAKLAEIGLVGTGWTATREPEVEHQGVPGHIDALLEHEDGRRHVVEFKTNYKAFGQPEPPPWYYVLQAAAYALAKNAPTFSIVTVWMAMPKTIPVGKGPDKFMLTVDKVHQQPYLTEPWSQAVDIEIARLKTALLDTPPPADPKEAFRCGFCRFSGCPRNKNPLNPERIPA